MDTSPTSKPAPPSSWDSNLYSLLPKTKMPHQPQTFVQKMAFKLADVRAPLIPMCVMLFGAHVFVLSYIFSDEFLLSEDADDENLSPTAKNLMYYATRTKDTFKEIKSQFSAFMPTNTSSANFEQIKQTFSGSKSS